jgi:hypothetical protein
MNRLQALESVAETARQLRDWEADHSQSMVDRTSLWHALDDALIALDALPAALAVAEEVGAGLFVVPDALTQQLHPDDMTESQIEDADWRYAYEKMVEGIQATLAGRVTL